MVFWAPRSPVAVRPEQEQPGGRGHKHRPGRSTWRDRALGLQGAPLLRGTRAGRRVWLGPGCCSGRLTCCGTIFSTASLSHLAHSPSLSSQQPVPEEGDSTLYPSLGRESMQLVPCLRRWVLAACTGATEPGRQPTQPRDQEAQMPGPWSRLSLLSAAESPRQARVSSPPRRQRLSVHEKAPCERLGRPARLPGPDLAPLPGHKEQQCLLRARALAQAVLCGQGNPRLHTMDAHIRSSWWLRACGGLTCLEWQALTPHGPGRASVSPSVMQGG